MRPTKIVPSRMTDVEAGTDDPLQRAWLVFLFFVCGMLGGCFNPWPKSVGPQLCAALEDRSKILEQIKDVESAKALLSQLEDWEKKFDQLHSDAVKRANKALTDRVSLDRKAINDLRKRFDRAEEVAKRECERLEEIFKDQDGEFMSKIRQIGSKWYRNPFE